LIVRDIVFWGKKIYGEFLKSEEGIATNILASRLEFLGKIGVLRKIRHRWDQRKDVYHLTEKGLNLISITFEIVLWSAAHNSDCAAHLQPRVFEITKNQSWKDEQKSTRTGSARRGSFYKGKPAIKWVDSSD
jgi:DNA-binding HxlR family transcriptional regulator